MAAILLGFLGGIGTGEVVILLVVILLFFGAKRIPDLARGLGKGIKEFKDAKNGSDEKETVLSNVNVHPRVDRIRSISSSWMTSL